MADSYSFPLSATQLDTTSTRKCRATAAAAAKCDVVKTACDSSPPYEVMSWIPLAIAFLGQLMLFASTVPDVSINDSPEGKGKFDRIEYPGSWRATLLQICNLGYETFSTAHLKMMKILYNSQAIIQSLNEAEKIMQKATPDNKHFISQFVLTRFGRITLAAENCQTESNAVVTSLTELEKLMEEVIEAFSHSGTHKIAHQKKRASIAVAATAGCLATAGLVAVTGGVAAGFVALGMSGSKSVQHQKGDIVLKFKQVTDEKEKTQEIFKRELVQIAGCNFNQASYEDQHMMLKHGLLVIQELIESWRELERICGFINIQSRTFDKNNKTLIDNSPDTSPTNISETVLSISPVSQMICRIAKLYMDISSKHILPAIGKLNQYSAVHPNEISEVSRQLMESTKAAHDAIENAILVERQRIFKNT